jgi:hypothetical protein
MNKNGEKPEKTRNSGGNGKKMEKMDGIAPNR